MWPFEFRTSFYKFILMNTVAKKTNFYIDKECYLVYKNDKSYMLPKKEF